MYFDMFGFWNMQPQSVHGVCNADTQYYKRQLIQLIYGRYDFTLPKDWKLNWFRFLLFGCGSLGVFYTKKYGWRPLPYSILKVDEQYNPRLIQSASAYGFDVLPKGIVDLNCGIIKIRDDFYGMDDILTHYATKLAAIDKGVNVNLMNVSLGMYAEVSSKNEARDIKDAYSRLSEGEPMVVQISNRYRQTKGSGSERKEFKTMLANPKNSYLVNDFLDARKTIVNQFLTDVGINNSNIDKKERTNTVEVNANNDAIEIAHDYILDNMRIGIDSVNRISGLGLAVDLHKTTERSDVSERYYTERDVQIS